MDMKITDDIFQEGSLQSLNSGSLLQGIASRLIAFYSSGNLCISNTLR